MNRKIRILNLAYTLPAPPYSGYDLRHLNLMRNLAGRIEQTLLCRITHPLTDAEKEWCENAPYEVRTVVLPRPNPLQKFFKALRFLTGPFPLMAAGWHFKEMERTLRKTLSEEPFDFIVLEGIWLSVYWPVLIKSNARLVLNLYDLEAGLLQRRADTLPFGLRKLIFMNGAHRMRKLEQTLPSEADLVWTVSEVERQTLLMHNPDLPVFLAPGGVDCDALRPLPPKPESKEILFVGSMQYGPNVDGIRWFVKKIMPLILAECPDAVLRVIGRKPDRRVTELHQPPSVIIEGEVEEVRPFYETCRLCVVPLRSGGGTRLKILEALALGRPVVSTSIGAEGIDIQNGRDILIADTPADMAHSIIGLLHQTELADRIARNGRHLAEERYNWKNISDIMYRQYCRLTDQYHERNQTQS